MSTTILLGTHLFLPDLGIVPVLHAAVNESWGVLKHLDI